MWAYLHTADDSALFQLSGPWKLLGEFSLCGRTHMQRVSVITRGRVTLLLLDCRNLADNFTASADTRALPSFFIVVLPVFPSGVTDQPQGCNEVGPTNGNSASRTLQRHFNPLFSWLVS